MRNLFYLTFAILILILTSNYASAAEVAVFSVNKTLSMGPKDTVFRDYYLNGGTEEGFRRGMIVTVVRRVPVHDLSRNRALGDLRVPVAKLKLIYVNRAISVGRVDRLIQPTNLPATEFAAVMVGDTISLGNGLDDLGRMDDGEGDGEKLDVGGKAEGNSANLEQKAEVKTEVAAVSEAPAPAAKPAPATIVPEKNAEQTDLNTKPAMSEKPKKPSAKAPKREEKPLKLPAKSDNSSDHDVVAPTA